jgi:hypothetical protein
VASPRPGRPLCGNQNCVSGGCCVLQSKIENVRMAVHYNLDKARTLAHGVCLLSRKRNKRGACCEA